MSWWMPCWILSKKNSQPLLNCQFKESCASKACPYPSSRVYRPGPICLDPHVKEPVEDPMVKEPVEDLMVKEPVEDLMVRDSSKATSSTPKVTPEMKIFKISTCPQKNGGQLNSPSKVDTNKEAMPIKDDHTEIDSNKVAIAVTEPKSVKRPRRDVTYKTILRKCRKFYQTRFNHHTGYLKNKKKEPCSFYRACILKFIDSYFEYNTHLNVSFHLGCLLYPQEMTRGIESFVYPNGVKTFTPKKVVKRKIETHKQQVDKLHSILYKFTHEKLDKFISVPELAAIFVNFSENVLSKAFYFSSCCNHLFKCRHLEGPSDQPHVGCLYQAVLGRRLHWGRQFFLLQLSGLIWCSSCLRRSLQACQKHF
ncbi:unnamed protein product [Moneuplotes crassus]|uniref:Uncharacterized protein n=1 Tax=Euplotes crassus TaxID=5936 RepID=A0AAD1XF90_EUPCR|nr:unnamed protein product [Moneuplotes crassus]